MSNIVYYYDQAAGRLCDAAGGANYSPPKITYQDKPVWELRSKTVNGDTVTAFDLSVYLAWEFAINNDFVNTLIAGALTAGFSGAVTAITADGFASAPPAAGFIRMTNGAGDSEDVYYSSYSGTWASSATVLTFVVSTTLANIYLNDDVCSAETSPKMCRTLNADIDDSQSSTGVIVVKVDASTGTFIAKLGTLQNKKVYARLRGTAADGSKIVMLFEVLAQNDPDPTGGILPGPPSAYITAAEIAATYQSMILDTQIPLPAGSTPVNLGAAATYRSVGIKGQITGSGTYTIVEGDVIHNGSTATPYIAPKHDILDDITFSADISAGELRLLITNTGAAKTLVYGLKDKTGVSI